MEFYGAKSRYHLSFRELCLSMHSFELLVSLFFFSLSKADTDHHVVSSDDGVRWLLIATRIKHDRDEVSEYLTREGGGEGKRGRTNRHGGTR